MRRTTVETVQRGLRVALAVGAALALLGARAERARACGGLFCSGRSGLDHDQRELREPAVGAHRVRGQPRRARVTAVIQIVYEGPADRFAWILPVLGCAGGRRLVEPSCSTRCRAQTDRHYQVTTVQQLGARVGFSSGSGNCGCNCLRRRRHPSGAAGSGAPSGSSELGGPAVRWCWRAARPVRTAITVLQVNPLALEPAEVAIEWLTANGYDVGALGRGAAAVPRDGLNLIAFRLRRAATPARSVRWCSRTSRAALDPDRPRRSPPTTTWA